MWAGFSIYSIMENYYQRNMDQYECSQHRGVQYNQMLDRYDNDDSGGITYPVTVEEVKAFAAIDIDEDDSIIEHLIPAALQQLEEFTNIGFINRRMTAIFNNGNGGFYLPMGPVTDTPTGADQDGNEIDLTVVNNKWKQVLLPRMERISATYNGGYEVLPQVLKTALLNQIRYLYDNRAEGKTDISPIALLALKPIARIW